MILQGEQIGKERMRGGAVLLEMGLNGSFALFREKSFSLVRKYSFRKNIIFYNYGRYITTVDQKRASFSQT